MIILVILHALTLQPVVFYRIRFESMERMVLRSNPVTTFLFIR